MTSDASDMYIYKDEEEEEAPIIEAFPAFLVQLTNLRELNISFQFMKEIPDDVAYLSNLRVLRCSENKWPLAVVVMPRIASITPKIARLTKLEVLDFHNFMAASHLILTDSGGFQVFSHNDAVKLTDEGVRFIVNDYDGRHVFWTPEDNMEIAMKLGSDICMQLDQCPGYPATRAYVERAVELSSMWAERCYKAHTRDDQALFGIVQGGMHLDLRLRSLRHLEECGDFPGYGIGGYSVGEDHETMFETLAPLVSEYMPKHKPRYLMGVGNPTTLVRGVGVGIDMFDCVLPTRTGRMGTAFSSEGRLNFRNARFAHDDGPIDPTCTCPVCTGGYSRALIRHMVTQKEMLGGILLSMHNIYYLLNLMQRARQAIIEGRYGAFVSDWMNSPAAVDY